MIDLKTKLRQEKFLNNSGNILRRNKIPILKENHYYVKPWNLDGDAPKEFIKAYFFEPDSGVLKNKPKSWFPYIAKTAEKWYPHESIIEYMINRIGQELGLNMNEIRLAEINGQIRFLSRYFRNEGERLVHGAEICGQYLKDDEFAAEVANNKNSARDFFTFEFICEAIREIYPDCCEPLITGLVKMITYDALTGNNDRHFYNWGIIDYAKVSKRLPKFAPIYDSARGLSWNWSDSKIIKILNDKSTKDIEIDKYINKSAPRISCESNKNANHFELVQFLKGFNSYKSIIEGIASEENEKKVKKMLEKEFFPHFVKERNDIVTLIAEKRFKIVREI